MELTARRYANDGTHQDVPAGDLDGLRLVADAEAELGGFLWIGLADPQPELLREYFERFLVHRLVIDDITGHREQPKVQWFGDELFLVIWALDYHRATQRMLISEVDLFARDGLIITVQRGQRVERIAERLDATRFALSGGAITGVHAIVADIVDGYADVGATLEAELLELEDQVFDAEVQDDAVRIYRLRNHIGKVDRAVSAIAAALSHNVEAMRRFGAGHASMEPYVLDLVADLVALDRLTDDQKAAIDSIIATHENTVASQVSEDSRKISSFAALLAIPAVVAGLYGMNFKNLPGTNDWWGWIAVAAVLVGLELWAYLTLRRRGWL